MDSDFDDVGDYEPPDVEPMGWASEITLGHGLPGTDGVLTGRS
jgi:hypothetical protein